MEQVSTGVRARATLTCPPQSDPHVKLEWWIEGSQGDEQEPMEDFKTLIEEWPVFWNSPERFGATIVNPFLQEG